MLLMLVLMWYRWTGLSRIGCRGLRSRGSAINPILFHTRSARRPQPFQFSSDGRNLGLKSDLRADQPVEPGFEIVDLLFDFIHRRRYREARLPKKHPDCSLCFVC